MQQDSIHLGAAAQANVGFALSENVKPHGKYIVECRDSDGNLKWKDEISNIVVTAGLNNLLDSYLAGSAYTAAFYLGLVDGTSAPTFAAADTMTSHAGWTENQAYTNTTRPAPTWSAASGGAKSFATAVAFTANAAATIAGCFLVTNSTKGSTTGTLFSEGAFTGGNKTLASGDVINVSYTLTA